MVKSLEVMQKVEGSDPCHAIFIFLSYHSVLRNIDVDTYSDTDSVTNTKYAICEIMRTQTLQGYVKKYKYIFYY